MTSIKQSIKKSQFERKKYRCSPLKSLWKAPQRKGTAMKFRIMTPKKPNSAKRRIVRLVLTNGLKVTAKIKGRGHFLQVYSEVLACGGRANDLPGVRFNMIKGGTYGFSFREQFNRKNSKSKYGKNTDDHLFACAEEYEKKMEIINQENEEMLALFGDTKDYSDYALIQNRYGNFGDLHKMNEKYKDFNKNRF